MAISNARNDGLTPEQLMDSRDTQLTGRIYRAYLDRLHAYQAIDFDDLILKPIDELRRDALGASPPRETGDYRDAELVELTTLDDSIKLFEEGTKLVQESRRELEKAELRVTKLIEENGEFKETLFEDGDVS